MAAIPSVFFTKLPKRRVDKDELFALCKPHGKVVDVLVFYGRGMALVEFEDVSSANKMLAHYCSTSLVFSGKKVEIERGTETIDKNRASKNTVKHVLSGIVKQVVHMSKQAEQQRKQRESKRRKLAAKDQAINGGEASPFGNFHNYYKFNPPNERLQYIPAELGLRLFQQANELKQELTFLDVGCNEGDMTFDFVGHLLKSLACPSPPLTTTSSSPTTTSSPTSVDDQLLEGVKVRALGVDIDSALIDGALKKTPTYTTPRADFHFEVLSIMEPASLEVLTQWLTPAVKKFDVISCFSITMWIHLHHGDEGLKRFLSSLASLTHNLIIEPQPWKCYQSCRKRWRRNNIPPPVEMATLTWRLDVDKRVISFLTEHCGLHVQSTGNTHWGRNVVWLNREMPKPK